MVLKEDYPIIISDATHRFMWTYSLEKLNYKNLIPFQENKKIKEWE